MGQYYLTANVDNFEFLDPHELGDGLKLMEFGTSGNGTMMALAGMLVLNETQRGPWVGGHIVVSGDYADEGRFVPPSRSAENLYTFLRQYPDDEEGAKEVVPESPAPVDYTVPKSVSALARDWVAQLGTDVAIRGARSTRSVEVLPVFAEEARVYAQPEDLVEAFKLTVGTPESSMEDILWMLRLTSQASPLAGHKVVASDIRVSLRTKKATEWVVSLVPRREDAKPVRRSLKFPATGQAVKDWLKVD